MGYIVLHMMGIEHIHRFFINQLEIDSCRYDLIEQRMAEIEYLGFKMKCIEVLDDELQRIDIYPY